MKKKMIDYYMDVAVRTSELSTAERLKVGAIVVKDDKIISCGYNGSPSGHSNILEQEVMITTYEYDRLDDIERERYRFSIILNRWVGLKTLDDVIHAEQNAISHLCRSTESSVDSILFCTTLPCHSCSKIIYGAGIKTVYYKNEYRCNKGLEFLQKCGIEVIKYEK